SYTNEISTLAFNPDTASINVSSTVKVGHHPSWITFYPGDQSLIFTCLEQSDGVIIALKFDEEGKGKIVAEIPSGGADPCTLFATNDTLYIGSGPDTSRQESSHPHQVIIIKEYGELLVPDLGVDVVRRFKTDGGTGLLAHLGDIAYAPGGGPRHVAFHGTVIVKHRFPLHPELPTFVKSVPTMSNPLPNGMLAAEVLIPTPNSAYPTPYLYLSNRNDPSSDGDIISIFAISGPDTLDLVTEVRSGLKHLRGMLFGGPDDKWLVAGGGNGGGVKIFERIDGGKDLKVVAENPNVESVTGFLWR
ncbi:hypothetical protein C0993_000542, partial [Termitomyces sp. T159_Od127]